MIDEIVRLSRVARPLEIDELCISRVPEKSVQLVITWLPSDCTETMNTLAKVAGFLYSLGWRTVEIDASNSRPLLLAESTRLNEVEARL
jgi:hypothetical protein